MIYLVYLKKYKGGDIKPLTNSNSSSIFKATSQTERGQNLMDNVSLFKRIEGKNLVISTQSALMETTSEANHVRISMDGEIAWDKGMIGFQWDLDPAIEEVEDGVFEIRFEKEMVIITITEENS